MPTGAGGFVTTDWSAVLQAGQSPSPLVAGALEKLCRTYWPPLYSYVRRKGLSPHDAEDLTQEFFGRLLRLNSLSRVGREKGRFRTFLLASVNHFLSDEWDRARAQKRGGGQRLQFFDETNAEEQFQAEGQPAASPERQFDRRWALTVLNGALNQLSAEQTQAGKAAQFAALKNFLSAEAAAGEYDALAASLNLTPGAIAVAVHRLRQRYGELVRAEVANTVANPADVDAELDYLCELVAR